MYWFDVCAVDQFLLPTVREIAIIAAGDRSLLDCPISNPERLQVAVAPLVIRPLVAGSGIVFLAAGSGTLRGSFGHPASISHRRRGAAGANRGSKTPGGNSRQPSVS